MNFQSFTSAIFGVIASLHLVSCTDGGSSEEVFYGRPSAEPHYVYVSNHNSNLLSIYSVNNVGDVASLGTVAVGPLPVGSATDPHYSYLYVANYGAASISQFTIESDGTLTPMDPPTVYASPAPISIVVDPSGTHLYVANSGGVTIDGNIGQYSIGSDGKLTAMTTPTVAAGSNPISLAIHSSGGYLYAANFRSNDVSQFSIGINGSISSMVTATVAAGHAPRSIAIDPTGSHVYVTNLDDNSISQYSVMTNGSLVAKSPALADVAPRKSYSIVVSTTGKNVYAASFSNAAVGQFAIGVDGKLERMSAEVALAESAPYAVAVDPSGHFAYVANRDGASISQYTIDNAGSLIPTAVPSFSTAIGPIAITIAAHQ